MKQLQDIDFRAAYGPVPDGFSRSVQQALHQTKEEPMKKFTLRTAVMAVVTVLVLTAVAFAANEVINPTVVPTPITQFQPVDSGEDTSSTPQNEITPSATENALYTSTIPTQPSPQPVPANVLIATDDSILEENGCTSSCSTPSITMALSRVRLKSPFRVTGFISIRWTLRGIHLRPNLR